MWRAFSLKVMGYREVGVVSNKLLSFPSPAINPQELLATFETFAFCRFYRLLVAKKRHEYTIQTHEL